MGFIQKYFKQHPRASLHLFMVLILVGVLFALFSFFSLFHELHHEHDQVSGRVTEIATNHITIESARGESITLVLMPQTHLSGPHQSPEEMVVGSIVHSFGEWNDERSFLSTDIRVVREPR